MLDTGSWRLDVPGHGTLCGNSACPNESVFDPNNSSTFKNLSFPYTSYNGTGKTTAKGFTVRNNLFFDNGEEISSLSLL